MASPVRSLTPARSPLGSPFHLPFRSPKLQLVPRRRRVAWFAVSVVVLVAGVMMGAILVHTRIAERQLEIDQFERSVRQAQEDFDILRSERAELRSPTRLASEAAKLGMLPGQESEFVEVDPLVLAITIARTGEMPVNDEIIVGSTARLEPLDQFRLVKSVGSETP
jgi:cell division protein FtsL